MAKTNLTASSRNGAAIDMETAPAAKRNTSLPFLSIRSQLGDAAPTSRFAVIVVQSEDGHSHPDETPIYLEQLAKHR
jgi:hypothetical protein